MKIVDTANRRRVQRQLLNLLPPPTRTLNITSGTGLASDIKLLVDDYAKSTKVSFSALTDVLPFLPFRQPIYTDFLIHSPSLHNDEKFGVPLFKFKNVDPNSTIDVVFTPLSLFSLFETIKDTSEAYPKMRRMSMLLYDGAVLSEIVSNLQNLIDTKTLHNAIMPVGCLVGNMQSTFLNKITSVMKGPILSKNGRMMNSVKTILPTELYLDLDEWVKPVYNGELLPTPSHAAIYLVLVYLTNGPEFLFVKSVTSKCQVMNALRQYFASQIINSYDSLGGDADLDISKMVFGALTRLGFFSTVEDIKQSTLNFKTSNIPVVEIDGFVSDVATWDILI